MKYFLSTIGLITLVILSASAIAAGNESTTKLTIKGLNVHSNDDTLSPSYSDLMALQFDSIIWATTSSCASNLVLVKSGETNLISTILAAYMSKTPIQVHVDDSSPAPLNGRCFIRAISL